MEDGLHQPPSSVNVARRLPIPQYSGRSCTTLQAKLTVRYAKYSPAPNFPPGATLPDPIIPTDNFWIHSCIFYKIMRMTNSHTVATRKTGLLTILVKSIADTNTNTAAEKYCQYRYQSIFWQYFLHHTRNAINNSKCNPNPNPTHSPDPNRTRRCGIPYLYYAFCKSTF